MNPLEIVVTGKVDGAKSALQTVQGELGKTALAAQKTDSSLDAFGRTMQRFGKSGAQTIALLTNKIEVLKAEMVNVSDVSVLSKFNKEISATELQLSKFQNAGKKGFNEVGEAAGSIGKPLTTAYNSLRRIAYVLPGVGIGGLVAFAIGPIMDWVQELMKGSDEVDLLKKNLDNLNEVMANANKKAGEQITDLKILYKAATDVNLSMKDRLAAVKQLQKEFPDYFGNISKESILNGDAKKSYDDLTTSILATAKATAAKAKLDELESKVLDAEYQKQKIRNAAANEAAKAKTKNLASQTTGSSLTGGGIASEPVVITREEQIRAINVRRDAALKLQDQNINILKQQEDFLTKFASLPSLAQVIEKKDKGSKSKGKDLFEVDLAALEDNYKKAQALLVKEFHANLTNSSKNTTAVNDILLKLEEDFLEKKLELIKKYGKKEGETELQISKNNISIINNQLKFQQEQLATLTSPTKAPSINFEKQSSQKIDTKAVFEYSDAIKKNIKLQQQQLELFNETATTLNKTLGPAFDTLFVNLLEGSGNALKQFGDAIKQIIVQLAAAVLKAALFAAILSVVTGGASTTGGFSFMEAFKKISGFSSGGSVKGYADGGSISGPGTSTSDSILARLSKGEYVMSAKSVAKFGSSFFDSLNNGFFPKFAQGGPVGSNVIMATPQNVFIPDVKLKGQDLIIAFNRATARASRNG